MTYKAEYPKDKNDRFTWRVMRVKGKKTEEVARSGKDLSWVKKHGATLALKNFMGVTIEF